MGDVSHTVALLSSVIAVIIITLIVVNLLRPMRRVACQAAVACPLPIGDHVLMGAGATFGCAVLEQEQLLERAPREKARRERRQQGDTFFSVQDSGIGRTLLLLHS